MTQENIEPLAQKKEAPLAQKKELPAAIETNDGEETQSAAPQNPNLGALARHSHDHRTISSRSRGPLIGHTVFVRVAVIRSCGG